MKLKCVVFLAYAVISNVQSQTAVISNNPDLLYSTSNDVGPWGSPEFLNSFTNDYGPIGGPDWLGSVSNDYGVGLKPSTLLILTPSLITPEELAAPLEVDPIIEP